MSVAPHESNWDSYRPVSTTETEENSLCEIPLLDVAAGSDRLSPTPTVKVYELPVVKVGSLSRNTYSSWYFVGHGAVDAALTFGPVFFFSELSSTSSCER